MGVDPVEFAGLDQGSDDGSVLGAAIGAGEECIFPIQGQRADGAFDGIGIDLDAAVVQEEANPGPAREGTTDRFSELGFLADEREFFPQPGLERLDQRSGAFLADGAAFLGRAALDLGLDPIEGGDPRQGLGRDWRGTGRASS